MPAFMGLTVSVVRRLERADGLVGWSLWAQPFARTFWTSSAWTDERALGEFETDAAQRRDGRAPPPMGPTRFTTWKAGGSTLPIDWDDALTRPRESPQDVYGTVVAGRAPPRGRPHRQAGTNRPRSEELHHGSLRCPRRRLPRRNARPHA